MTLSDQSQIDFLSTPSLIRSEWKSSFFEIEFSRNKSLNIDEIAIQLLLSAEWTGVVKLF